MTHLLWLLIHFYVFPLTSWWLTVPFVAVIAMYGLYALMYSHGEDRRKPFTSTIGFVVTVLLWPIALVVLPVLLYRRNNQLSRRPALRAHNARLLANSQGRGYGQ